MSVRAHTKLRDLWRNLEVFTVDRMVAREPDDVLYIELRKPPVGTYPDGRPMYNSILPTNRDYRRLDQVPEDLRPHARVVWQQYHGYTTTGVRFDRAAYNALDFDVDFTLDYGTWGNHHGAGDLPQPGQLICGELDRDANGTAVLRRWFTCDHAFRLLLTTVKDGPRHTEDELGHLLLTMGFPDTYFAIARLVFFDNVQAFVDGIKVGKPGPSVEQMFMGAPPTISSATPDVARHPAYGATYAGGYRVDWRGMYLATSYAQQVHELSRTLDEPAWWSDFLRLAADQGVVHSHPGRGGACRACAAEHPDWPQTGFPYQLATGTS